MSRDRVSVVTQSPGVAALGKRLAATKVVRGLRYARLHFFTEPPFCTLGSRVRLTACMVGLGRLVGTVRVRLLPFEVDVRLRTRTADIETARTGVGAP